MGINIHTIKDIRSFLSAELDKIYQEPEKSSLINIVLKSVTGISIFHQLYDPSQEITESQANRLFDISNELKKGKPVQYILGETEFYGLRILLNEETLIPRPETEELVHLIIRENKDFSGKIIDFGSGSGCIAIALAANIKNAVVTGIEISEKATEKAKKNAALNGVKVNFTTGDMLNPDTRSLEHSGIIVSNPPYVRESEKTLMHRNVLDFEPTAALFVPDGNPLKYYSSLVKTARKILLPGGKIYFEINEAMGAGMYDLLASSGFSDVSIVKDINNKDRIIKGKKHA
ncbi:MAG TPA: peptide chain release factor N(5)-glutamine methyltransferase [Bacteroidales bacterium]|nr:peptide chain release factor N(5)-glutamine methyltransferase [Bacteroidales bacterium]